MRAFDDPPRIDLARAFRDHWILGLIAIGLAIRLAYIPSHGPEQGDQALYLFFARDFAGWWANTLGDFAFLEQVHRMPGYVGFVTVLHHVGGSTTIRITQAVVLSAGCLLMAIVAARAGGLRVGRATAAVSSCYLPFVMLPSVLLPDALSASLLGVALYLSLEARWSERRLWMLAGASAALTMAVMVRPNNFIVAPLFIAIAVAVGWKEDGIRLAAALALPVVILFTPWIARNLNVYGEPEPLGKSESREEVAAAVTMPVYRAAGRYGSAQRSTYFAHHSPPGPPIDYFEAADVDPWTELRGNLIHHPLEQIALSGFWLKELLVVPFDDHAAYEDESVFPWALTQATQVVLLVLALIGLWAGRRLLAVRVSVGAAAMLIAPFAIFLPEPRYAAAALLLLLVSAGMGASTVGDWVLPRPKDAEAEASIVAQGSRPAPGTKRPTRAA